MSISRLLLACIALFWLGCASAATHSNQATARAFDALLSMPQAQPPDNHWDVETPKGYDGTSEDDLIAWLAQQRRDGADLNAYRHYGTLLQHAIRSHMLKVVRWLLAHGADPTLKLSDGSDDSLGIAINEGQWPMVKTLLATPAFRQRPPQQLVAYYQPYAGVLTQLVKHGFAIPSGDTARCMLQKDLSRGYFKSALQLPVNRPLVVGGKTATTQSPWCASRPLAPGSFNLTKFATLSPAMLEKLDAKLAEPLLPYLIPTLKTAQDVEALFALPLRKPNAMSELLGRWAVSADPEGTTPPFAVRKALAQRLPQGMLASLLSDEKALGTWLGQAAESSTADFAYALKQVPAATLAAYPAVAANAIYGNPGNAQQWSLLLALPELRLDGDNIPRLLQRVPSELWPQLLAHGYRLAGSHADARPAGAPDEAIQWLRATNAQAIRKYWPLLTAHQPDLVDRAVASLLQPCISQSALDKIRALLALGAKVQAQPFPAPKSLCTELATYAQLLTLGVISRPVPNATKRFVYAPTQCRLNANDAWLKTLTMRPMLRDYGAPTIDTIQPIDYPGQSACAVMVAGGAGSQETSSDNGDFYYGPSQENGNACGDPSPRVEQVWLRQGDHLETSELDEDIAGLLPLRDTSSGRRYYLAFAQPGDRCSDWSGPPKLLTWSLKPPYHLEVVDLASPAWIALQVQCGATCFHNINGYSPTITLGQTPWDAARSTNDFIDHFFAKQRADWIDAALKLDTEHLRQLEANGAPSTWALAGIDAVTHSKLPLMERRRRTAWLFRDGTRLSAAFDAADYAQTQEVVFGLDDWLPREDWRPLLNALAQATNQEDPDFPLLQRLADDAQAKGKSRLACRLSRVAGNPCAAATPIN
jgi:hypothetical protein